MELGIEIEVLNQKPFITWTSKEKPLQGKIEVVLFHFLSKRIGKILPGKNIREWKWIPVLELDDLAKKGELAPNIIPVLKHFGVI